MTSLVDVWRTDCVVSHHRALDFRRARLCMRRAHVDSYIMDPPRRWPCRRPLIGLLQAREGGSVAEWLACGTQVQKGPGSNRSRDAVG